MPTLAEQIELAHADAIRAAQRFKRILVHVDRDKHCDHRIEVAVDLAVRFAGTVAGVYASRPILPPAIVVGALPSAFMADEAELDLANVEAARRRYLDHVARRGMDGEWHYVREAAVPALRRMARYMDIAVVGQPNPSTADELVAVRPEELALGSGRPVLVVPYIGSAVSPGKRVVIAWDASREAARAVADALPLLARASSLWVVTIDGKGSGMIDRSDSAEDLCRYLADHGMQAKPDRLQTEEGSEADILLSRIADFGADLLVMGCYGHTRLRELVLGGMTREILQHMTVPVLMSH